MTIYTDPLGLGISYEDVVEGIRQRQGEAAAKRYQSEIIPVKQKTFNLIPSAPVTAPNNLTAVLPSPDYQGLPSVKEVKNATSSSPYSGGFSSYQVRTITRRTNSNKKRLKRRKRIDREPNSTGVKDTKEGLPEGESNTKKKRPYPVWLKKYQFKKRGA